MDNSNDDAMRVLECSFAEPTIQGLVRKSERMTLPPDHLLVQFNMMAKDVMDRLNGSFNSHRNDIISFFGAPTIVIAKLWELILHDDGNDQKRISNKEHLLWALHHVKQAPNFAVLCKTMKTNGSSPTKKTVLKWVWFHVREISELNETVILWENGKTNDRGDDCLVSVDCIDCPFQQTSVNDPAKPGRKMVNKALCSCKMNGPALRCEIAVSLLSNDIVWVNGPFCPGDWNDLEIFRHGLLHELEPGERVEADNMHVGEAPTCVVCPASITAKEEVLPLMKRVEGRHEALNEHVKNWKCVKGAFDVRGSAADKMEKHRALFIACAVAKQVAMQMGAGEPCEIQIMLDRHRLNVCTFELHDCVKLLQLHKVAAGSSRR